MMVPMNVNRFLNRANDLYGSKKAVFDQDMELTYHELWCRVQRLSHALHAHDVGLGDRVAWLGYNNHHLLEAYFGVVQYGAILVPLNIRLTAADLAVIMEDAMPKILIFDSDFEVIAQALSAQHPDMLLVEIQLEGIHPAYQGYEDLISGASSEAMAGVDDLDENSVAEIFYTSGTTGVPKGVGLTHRNLYMNAMNVMATSDNLSDRTVMLHTIPLFHVNGWGTPHYVTALGATHVMLRKFVPETVLRLIERHRATHASLVPIMVQALNMVPDVAQYDLSSLIHIMVGGAPSPSSFVSHTMETLGGAYTGGYGLSETSPIISVSTIKDTIADRSVEEINGWRGTAGIPLIGVDVGIADERDEALPWDGEAVGELRIRADVVMQGYWGKPEATEQVIRDGWFYTGDMASIDREGYIHIVDRKKDIIISGGENISSVELEDVLYTHPAVQECSVIGRPDPLWGEIPCALVVLKPGASVGDGELIQFANEHLSGFKHIKSVEVVAELPKTGTGKIQKNLIRKMYGAGWQR